MSNSAEIYLERMSPILHSIPIVLDTQFDQPARAILVGVAGNVHVNYVNGTNDTIYLTAGVWHHMLVISISTAGTTATGIHAGF